MTLPQFEGLKEKRRRIKAQRTLLVSRSGFVKDILQAVRRSKGTFRAWCLMDDALETDSGEPVRAAVRLVLDDGRADSIELETFSIIDTISGPLGYCFFGVSESLRKLVILPVTSESEEDGGVATAVVMGGDLTPADVGSIEFIVSSDSGVLDARLGRYVRSLDIPSGLVVD
ncbi:MAG: hypothetical protein M5U18_08465 [Dehalococcoidia bacterium]|nr:hypothetical protein [Dehalococcoidia bacterium]